MLLSAQGRWLGVVGGLLLATPTHAAFPPSSLGDRILSPAEVTRIIGSTSDGTSPPFVAYLWSGFTLPPQSFRTTTNADAFSLATDASLSPPVPRLTDETPSPAFILASAKGFAAPGLVGAINSVGTPVYLAAGFSPGSMGLTSALAGPGFPVWLDPLFGVSMPGLITDAVGASTALYLAAGFTGSMLGSPGEASAPAFDLRLTPADGGGLVSSANTAPFLAYLAGEYRVPPSNFGDSDLGAAFDLSLTSDFAHPAPFVAHAAPSGPFPAYLVADFVVPGPITRVSSLAPAFELALLALAGGREGFEFSPPFELNLYVFPTPVLASLVSAEFRDGSVHVTWEVRDHGPDPFRVERQEGGLSWMQIQELVPDSRGRMHLTDDEVVPGRRYGYRLLQGTEEEAFGEVWFDIPAFALALAGAIPNPAPRGKLTVRFTLPDASPANLEVIDVSGRRISSADVGSYGPGEHTVRLGAYLPPGVYFVRLSTASRSIVRKAQILH